MLPADTLLFSVDDHIHEHPNVWLDRLPRALLDDAPRVVELNNGEEAWSYEGQLIPIDAGTSLPRDDRPDMPLRPKRFDQMRPGCYDPKARLVDMDEDGVWAELGFPQWARFAGHRFYPTNNPELSLHCVKAYNDFVLEEWSVVDPSRLVPMAILPWWDVEASVAEVHRVAAMGAKALAFSENPTVLGEPSVHTEHWEPLWQAVSDHGLPLCMHIGSSSKIITSSADAPGGVAWTATGVSSLLAFADWLWSGIFDRYPAMKVAFSEGGAGWVPYALERSEKYCDTHYRPRGMKRRPREVFKDHMYVCFVTDSVAVSAVDTIGEDNLMWESDFPHTDGMWPLSRATLERSLKDTPERVARKIGSENAQRLFGVTFDAPTSS